MRLARQPASSPRVVVLDPSPPAGRIDGRWRSATGWRRTGYSGTRWRRRPVLRRWRRSFRATGARSAPSRCRHRLVGGPGVSLVGGCADRAIPGEDVVEVVLDRVEDLESLVRHTGHDIVAHGDPGS